MSKELTQNVYHCSLMDGHLMRLQWLLLLYFVLPPRLGHEERLSCWNILVKRVHLWPSVHLVDCPPVSYPVVITYHSKASATELWFDSLVVPGPPISEASLGMVLDRLPPEPVCFLIQTSSLLLDLSMLDHLVKCNLYQPADFYRPASLLFNAIEV